MTAPGGDEDGRDVRGIPGAGARAPLRARRVHERPRRGDVAAGGPRAALALYADIGVTSPRLTHAVEQQKQDHHWFLEEVERLLTERDEGLTDESALAAHREAATSLVGRLVRHRQRGSDLIYEAYAVDIGGSD